MGRFDDSRRYHSLDQLRAMMMILGLVIHSSASYVVAPLGAAWPYKDTATSVLNDIAVFFIHIFRMPLFFLMAGFFTAFLYSRRGAWGMLRNRLGRVLAPFALFLAVLYPLTSAGFKFAIAGGSRGGADAALAYLANPAGWYDGLRTMHLWFLYYLLYFYVFIAVFMAVAKRFAGGGVEDLARRLGRLIHHPLGVAIGATVTFLTLLPMRAAGLDTETAFLVEPKILVSYGIFMGFGWVLYLNREEVDRFGRSAWPYITAGAVLSSCYLAYSITAHGRMLLLGKALCAASMWTLIYGFIGLFVRYYDHPRPLGRYLADASYWLYLVHLPVTIWVPGLLSGWSVPALVKVGVTLVASGIFSLTTYHAFVRSTLIGAFLNGKRYERGLPQVTEAPAQNLASA